jgi:regulator of protease activity HflC (stomatin/prohibitin superfamily)
VRFHPDAAHVYRLHQRVGPDYINKIIRPEIRSQTRVVIAEFTIDDVYSKRRDLVQRRISERLKRSLSNNDLIVDEVLLRDIQFSQAYAEAVERKQISEQHAQRMLYVLQKAELEKRQKILEAAPNVSAIITDGGSVNLPFSQKN